MATNKTIKIDLEIENTKKVGDEFKNLKVEIGKMKIEAISAKEIVQSYINSLPPTLDIIATKLTNYSAILSKDIFPNMEKINKLNKLIIKSETDLNTLKQTNIKADISALSKANENLKKIIDDYSAKEKKLIEKRKKAEDDVRKRNKEKLDAAAGNAEVLKAVYTTINEQLKLVDQQFSEAFKKNRDEELSKVEKFIADYVNEEKRLFREKQNLAIETATIERKKIEDSYDELTANAKNAEERINIEQQKNEKLKEFDRTFREAVKVNIKEHQNFVTTETTEFLQLMEERVKETRKNTSGITDITLTKENIEQTKEILAEYKRALADSEKDAKTYYSGLELIYRDDAQMLALIQEEKAATLKAFAAESEKIEKTMTEVSQKENALRFEQVKDFAKKTEEVASNIKDFTSKVSDYLGAGLGAVSDIYKTEIGYIETEIDSLNKLNKEYTDEVNEHNSQLTALDNERAEAVRSNNQAEVDAVDAKIAAEKSAHQNAVDSKKENDDKIAELNEEKNKKEAQQEKIDRLKRKTDLISQIGTATASVAQGVTKALAYGPFLGPVLATVVAAAGAVQIGIMTKQLAKFENGGLLNGKRHAQGGMRIEGTNIEVEGGEYVVNRESTSKNLGLVRYINSQRKELTPSDINTYFSQSPQSHEAPFSRMFEAGGELPVINNTVSVDNDALVDAIKSIKFEPKVAVTDILRVQDEMTTVGGWAGM